MGSRVVITLFLCFKIGAALTTLEWKRRTVYQVITDRFALEKGAQDTCDVGGCQFGNFCGGTFRGIAEHLDYIAEMGFDAIWISPVSKNAHCGYHGYWTKSLFEVADEFGGADELAYLVNKAHDQGFAVMIDTVFNHVGPPSGNDFKEYSPFDSPEFYHGNLTSHCNALPSPPTQHLREVCWFGFWPADCPDLNQDHPATYHLLIKWITEMMDRYKFDAIRVDSAPFVNKTFYKKLKKVFPDTYIVAEVALGDVPLEYTASYQYTFKELTGEAVADNVYGPILDGVINYYLWGNIKNTFQSYGPTRFGSPLSLLAKVWEKNNATFKDLGASLTFVENHDQRRWLLDSPDWNSYKQGFICVLFMPGIPVAYYGTEQGMRGGPQDNELRQPLWQHGGYNESSPLFLWTKRAVTARGVMLNALEDDKIDEVKYLDAEEYYMSFQRGPAVVVLCHVPGPDEIGIMIRVRTDHPAGTVLCDALRDPDAPIRTGHCSTVDGDGFLPVTLEGQPLVLLPPSWAQGALGKILTWSLILIWLIPAAASMQFLVSQKRVVKIVQPILPEQIDGPPACVKTGRRPNVVLVASLEHVIVHGQGPPVKVVAGGLGKVAGLLCQYHPGTILSVHPCMDQKDYSFAKTVAPVKAKVAGEELVCEVYCFHRPQQQDGAPNVTFYLVDHHIFRNRPDGIYPVAMPSRNAIAFYSLWNQVVGQLIDRLQPDLYHAPDYHTAMAVMYMERPLPVVVILHNAEHQGTVETQQMGSAEVKWFSEMFNLPRSRIENEAVIDGSFSMMKPLVEYVKKYQGGHGFCGVSRNYAIECLSKFAVFETLAEIRGIENCMPESERMAMKPGGEPGYLEAKRNAKRLIQEQYELNQDPDARIFVFLGRWVRQKGMDYIADVTEWMLENFEKAQLVMIGPVGDSYGSYTRMKMKNLMESGKFNGRLFVYAGFLAVPPDLKLACDFCLMPSRSEPFGYVDIEFAWFGAAIVGSFLGGLAKLPGFYYKILNADSTAHVQSALKLAIQAAMECSRAELRQMSVYARQSAFSVEEWKEELLRLYGIALGSFSSGSLNKTTAVAPSQEPSSDSRPLLDSRAPEPVTQAPAMTSPDFPKPVNSLQMKKPLSKGLSKTMPTIASMGDMEKYVREAEDADETVDDGLPPIEPVKEFREYDDSLDQDDPMSRQVSVIEVETDRQMSGKQVTPKEQLSSKEQSSIPRPAEQLLEDARDALEGLVVQPEEQEFLKQELKEETVQSLVEAKFAIVTLTKRPPTNAQSLLDEAKWELELAREPDSAGLMLGRALGTALRIDWIIAAAYISGPLVAAVYVSGINAASKNSVHGYLTNAAGCSEFIGESLFVLFWTAASMYISPRNMMCAAVMSRFLLFIPFLLPLGNWMFVWVLSFVAAGDCVLIYFNFMGKTVGDISILASRIGLLMAVHMACQWLFMPLMTAGSALRILLVVILSVLTIMMGYAIRLAPSSYHQFKLPNFAFQLRSLCKVRVLVLLGLSSLVRGAAYVPNATFLSWRNKDTLSLPPFADYCIFRAMAVALPPMLLAFLLKRTPSIAVIIVKAFAFFTIPCCMALQCWAMYDVKDITDLSGSFDALIVITQSFDSLCLMSSAVVVLATVGSRWKFIVYTCVVRSLVALSRAISFHALWPTAGGSPLETSTKPTKTAKFLFYVALISCAVELCFRVLASLFIDYEATSMWWTARQAKVVRMLGRLKLAESQLP